SLVLALSQIAFSEQTTQRNNIPLSFPLKPDLPNQTNHNPPQHACLSAPFSPPAVPWTSPEPASSSATHQRVNDTAKVHSTANNQIFSLSLSVSLVYARSRLIGKQKRKSPPSRPTAKIKNHHTPSPSIFRRRHEMPSLRGSTPRGAASRSLRLGFHHRMTLRHQTPIGTPWGSQTYVSNSCSAPWPELHPWSSAPNRPHDAAFRTFSNIESAPLSIPNSGPSITVDRSNSPVATLFHSPMAAGRRMGRPTFLLIPSFSSFLLSLLLSWLLARTERDGAFPHLPGCAYDAGPASIFFLSIMQSLWSTK
ncbi:hypothetical protein L249_0231, partial [Ophiocordyceps polyrhachis-furcata BCC 54312]